MGGLQRFSAQGRLLPQKGKKSRGRDSVCLQLYTCAAAELSCGCALRLPLARDAEQRCSALWRERSRKCRGRRGEPFADPRPAIFIELDTPAFRDRDFPAGGARCVVNG